MLRENASRSILRRTSFLIPPCGSGERWAMHPGDGKEVLAAQVQPGARGGQDGDLWGGSEDVGYQGCGIVA